MIESKQIYAIQFSHKIGDIEPFLGGGGSNIQVAFENVLQQLDKDIQADITICVVSDGHGESNLKALKQKIDAAKKKYQIQFTSIAVGSGYPFELFQEFRDHFHNGALSCTNVQFVQNSYTIGQDQCEKDFINAFEIVKSQLSQKKKVQVVQQVWESLTAQPTFFVSEGSVVASLANKLITKEGVDIKETRKATDIAKYIQTSCQEFLKSQSNEKYKDSIEQAKQMKQTAQDLYKRVDQSSSQNKENVNKVFQQIEKDLVILEQISIGKLDLKNLSDADKTKLLSDFSPQKAELQDVKQIAQDLSKRVDQSSSQHKKNITDIAEYIQTSSQDFLKTQSNEKFKDSIEFAKQMKQTAQDIYKRVDQSSSQHKENVNKVFQQIEKDLVILEEISIGKLDLKNLSDADKTKLLSDFSPQKAEVKEVKIQEAKLVEQTEEQKQEKFQQKLVELLNEKSEIPGHMVIISLMSDLIEEAIEEKKSQKDILEQFLNPKRRSLQTISIFTKMHKTWVEQFIDCYIKLS